MKFARARKIVTLKQTKTINPVVCPNCLAYLTLLIRKTKKFAKICDHHLVQEDIQSPGLGRGQLVQLHVGHAVQQLLHAVLVDIVGAVHQVLEGLNIREAFVREFPPLVGRPVDVLQAGVQGRLHPVEVGREELLEIRHHGVDGRVVAVQHHVHHVLVLVEPVLLGDKELVDAGQRDVQLAQLLVLLEKVVEILVEIDLEVSRHVGLEHRLGNHVFDLANPWIFPALLHVDLIPHQHHARVIVLLHQLPVLRHLLQVLLLLKMVDEMFEMVEQRADPIDAARGVGIVARHRSARLLALEELGDAVHLDAEGVDHALVLVDHAADGEDAGESLKPGEVLEGVGRVPDPVVG